MSTLGCTGIRPFLEAKRALPSCPHFRRQRTDVKDRVLVIFRRLGRLRVRVDDI